jgi:hypothetical protein
VCLGIGGAVITAAGLSRYEPPSHLQELDLTGCWLLPEDALLDFCEAHPQVMVWSEQTFSVSSAAKVNVHKKEYGDVVSGGLATSFSRELQQAKLNLRKSPAKLYVKDRMKVTKRPVNNSSIGTGIRTPRLTVLGMYLKSTRQFLRGEAQLFKVLGAAGVLAAWKC